MADQIYWASKPTSEIGDTLVEKVQDQVNHRFITDLRQRQARAYQYLYGTSADGIHATSQVLRTGDQGELAAVRVNHARSLLMAQLNLITSNKVIWTPKATNIDAGSLKQCELAEAILSYYWADKQVGAKAVTALEEALAFCEGFIQVEWDAGAGDTHAIDPDSGAEVRTGDVVFTNVSTWDVYRDPSKPSWDLQTWVIVKRRVNKFDLAAQHPNQSHDILKQNTADCGTSKQTESSNSDDVEVFYFYHKKTPAVPTGRQLQFLADGTILEATDGGLEYEEIPVYRLAAAEQAGSSFGYTPFHDLLGIQELMDSLHTAVASNQSTLATQCIVLEEGSEVPFDQIAGGMRAIYVKPGSKPPEALQLLRTPAEVFGYIRQLKDDQQQLIGLNDVVRGNAPSADMSGSAMALLDTAALRQSSVLQGNWLRFVQGLGQCLLYVFQTKATVPQKIAMVGRGQAFLVDEAEFTKDSLDRIKKVTVETGNPMSQTPAGRYSMATDLLKLMGPEKLNLEALVQVLQTGQVKPVTNSLTTQLLLIKSENEAMMRGEVPTVLVTDDHQLHMREHRSVLDNPQTRNDPAIVKAVLTHLDEHMAVYKSAPVDELLIWGMQPPPQVGPPMGAEAEAPPSPGGPSNPGVPNTQAARQPQGPTPGQQPQLPSLPNDPRTGEPHNPGAVGQPGPVVPTA